MRELVRKILEENGIGTDEEGMLQNVDSISFISTIVSLEQEFGIEFPDEFLLIDSLANIESIVSIITAQLG